MSQRYILEEIVTKGWLHVWDVDLDLDKRLFCAGRHPKPLWKPEFCVFRTGDCILNFSQTEQTDSDQNDQTQVSRLDGGREHFHKRWGYNLLDIITENTELLTSHIDELDTIDLTDK
ncbi:hypothetical protein BgiMline_020402 [Biomphalaria glabrata]|nr:ras GTPase-activating protein nGAP-like [Biomphalaria glabrata]